MSIHNTFYSQKDLSDLGFKRIGSNVLISRKASIYNPELVQIGDNSRIDDFCILSGEIYIGNYVHISAYSALYGKAGIILNDYSGLSPRTTIFSTSDDFGGSFMVGPLIPSEFTNVNSGKVVIEKYVQIGTSSVIMPSVVVGEGCAVGAFSFVKHSLPPWGIYAGLKIKLLKERKRDLLKYLDQF
jgi:acetyltransferase-like isoleucine patch superfamily enzyme